MRAFCPKCHVEFQYPLGRGFNRTTACCTKCRGPLRDGTLAQYEGRYLGMAAQRKKGWDPNGHGVKR